MGYTRIPQASLPHKTMRCEKCDFENPPGMKFCGHCASPLSQTCPRCGFANPANFAYCGQCGQILNSDAEATSEGPVAHKQHEAERRQLTVLFCDMIGSSSLSERIDPEDLRDIMCAYRNTCNEVISRYKGHVAQYLGDGILVYFGYPHAYEDDARRAIQAALELTERIPQLTYSISSQQENPLSVRVGVHTGLVVIGEMSGDKRSLALGETPNIAARLQGLAQPNNVIISAATHQLIEKYFHCQSLGEQQLKGFSQPMPAYQVENKFDTKQRNQAANTTCCADLVGRDQETSLLLERLDQARKGVGQVVLLNGEPGLGKSRMVQLVCDRLSDESCYLLECAGTPYYQNSFLAPIIDLCKELLGLTQGMDDREKIIRLEQGIAAFGLDERQILPGLAELLSLDLPSYYPSMAISTPQQRKQQVMESIIQIILSMAQQKLLVLIVEDLQWVDPSTLELLGRLMEQPGLTNLFILLTFRNEYTPPWTPHNNLTQVTLNRLTRQQSGSMIRQLCQGKTLPQEVFNEIVNKTDGIPYFVEELTRMVLQSDMLQEKADHYELTAPMSALSIPATLQDSLMSRLDCLGEDKELAQISATLGREFPHNLLCAVSERDELKLQSGLNRLINAELFFQRGNPPQSFYSFRHALLREAAYQSLLRRTRQKYHQRIAKLLKEEFVDIVSSKPELLAHHSMEAGDYEEAVGHWFTAGSYAIKRSANREAAAHLQNGLAALEQLPESPQRQIQELAFQSNLGLAIMMSEGYAAKGVERAYARAHALCRELRDANAVFPVLCGLWEYHIVRAELNIATQLSHELQNIAGDIHNPILSAEARRTRGTTLFWQGDIEKALALLEPLTQDVPQDYSSDNLVSYCQDAHVAALSNTACVLFLLGHADQGLLRAQQALELAKRLAHPFSQAYALNFLGTLHQLRGEHEQARHFAEAQIALSDTYGFSFWAAAGKMLFAWSESFKATPSVTTEMPCSERFIKALSDYESSGNRIARSYFMALLADILSREEKTQEARAVIEQALEEAQETGEGFFYAELLRIRGELAAKIGAESHLAYDWLKQALAMAQKQGASAVALKTGMSLVQWLIQEDRREEAYTLLTKQLEDMDTEQQAPFIHNALHLLGRLNNP